METKKLKATYYDEKDILYLQILPSRPARVDETRYGLMVRYDWDKPDEVVGFECLDFSLLIPHLAEPGVVPKLELRFDVEGTTLVNVTLTEVLHWAYERYVLRRPTVAQPQQVAALAVREEPETEYKP
ncbi:MAG: DUF2283 domain-containing protein [Anaerolineales bacterium]|nr:MAG: DUF2283 domain-containing protein [Anaerolineales bacterium]